MWITFTPKNTKKNNEDLEIKLAFVYLKVIARYGFIHGPDYDAFANNQSANRFGKKVNSCWFPLVVAEENNLIVPSSYYDAVLSHQKACA